MTLSEIAAYLSAHGLTPTRVRMSASMFVAAMAELGYSRSAGWVSLSLWHSGCGYPFLLDPTLADGAVAFDS